LSIVACGLLFLAIARAVALRPEVAQRAVVVAVLSATALVLVGIAQVRGVDIWNVLGVPGVQSTQPSAMIGHRAFLSTYVGIMVVLIAFMVSTMERMPGLRVLGVVAMVVGASGL